MEHEGAAFAEALAAGAGAGLRGSRSHRRRAGLRRAREAGHPVRRRVPRAGRAGGDRVPADHARRCDRLPLRGALGCTIRQISQAAIDDETAEPHRGVGQALAGAEELAAGACRRQPEHHRGARTVRRRHRLFGIGRGRGPTSVAIVSDLWRCRPIAASRDPTRARRSNRASIPSS